MKTPTVEQLQAWTQQWDEAKHYLSYQKVFDQRLQQSQPASDTAEISQVMDDLVNQVGQEGLGQDPTEVEQVVDNLVNQVAAKDQQAKNLQKAQVTGIVAGKHIATLRNELDRALEDLGLEPPWSAINSTSGLYRTDEHVIPLTIRLLDGLRLSKASEYADFAESDHLYGCKSPFAYSHLAVNTGLKDKITNLKPKQVAWSYRQELAYRVEMTEYVDELSSRLFNVNVDIMNIPAEKQNDIKNRIHADVSTLMARTEGDTLASIDAKMTEKTIWLVDRLMESYFSTWSQQLTDEENVELQTTTRSKIEQVFTQFNQEKNAERHLSDCFDLAFCAKASESDQSAAHLQALKDSGIKNISGVLRGASVDSARTLYDFPGSEHDLIEMAKYAVKISSYGLLRATLEAIATNNAHINFISRHKLIENAFKNSEASIIKQCLRIESTCSLRDCDEWWQFVLLKHAVRADVHSAGVRANEDRLQMLLNAGVNINAELGKCTLLMDYCKSGYVAEAIKLIEAGANVNAVDDGYGYEMTVLMTASMNGYEGLVKALIDAGAELNMCDQYGNTALIYACSSLKKKTVQMLVEAGADTNTALIYACKKGREYVVRGLIDAEIDINVKDENGLTALIHACLNYNIHNVKMLIGAGADVNAKDNSGMTALMHACMYKNIDIIKMLIRAGAEVNATTDHGTTALMYASSFGYDDAVEELLKSGAYVNTKDNNGTTALMEACANPPIAYHDGHEATVSKLIEAKADVNAKDSEGKTAYDYAEKSGNAGLANRVIALESVGTRANRIARETGRALGDPTVLTALAGIATAAAGITTAALYASGSLDTALESGSQAMPDIVSAATNATSQALTELTTAAIEIGRQIGYGPGL